MNSGDVAGPIDRTSPLPVMDTSWRCTWETGPDAGGSAVLGVGRHLVGRTIGLPVQCDDPALEPHHALLLIGVDGRACLVQLSGRVPLAIDGIPQHGTVILGADSSVELGDSLLRCLMVGTDEPESPLAHLRGQSLVRSPRALSALELVPLQPPGSCPDRTQPPGGLVPAALGLVGAGALALLMRQPMFLLFGVLGSLVALGSWGAQRLGAHRRTRRATRLHLAAVAEFTAGLYRQRACAVGHHLAVTTTPAAAREIVHRRGSGLWARRRDHPDAYSVSLGLGELHWQPLIINDESPTHPDAMPLETVVANLPVAVHLGPGTLLALRGDPDRTHGIARSLLVQLGAACGPADLRVVVVTTHPAGWQWLHGLPHATGVDGTPAITDERGIASLLATFEHTNVHVVIVTDQPELLAARTGNMRRAVLADRAPALVALVPAGAGVPHVCTAALTVPTTSPTGRWVPDTLRDALPEPVRVAGMSERSAAAAVARLSGLIDPEDTLSGPGALPRDVGLGDLLTTCGPAHLDPAAIAAGWAADATDPSPSTAIGMAADGIVDIDLVRDGPHGLLAGTTGSGKSELLRSLVAGMAVHASPRHLNFVLVDYKGGSTFDACTSLPHVVGVVTDLDEHLAARALRSLHAELRRRETLLREHAATDLAALRAVAPEVVLPRLVVVIDEFAALVSEQPDFLHALVGVAQRGRSLGVHLLLATQRPNGVISDDIRANTNLRLALRLHDASDAIDVVGDVSPALIPRGMAGRAVMRLGPNEFVTFQTARSHGELEGIVNAVRGAAAMQEIPPARRPWLPPLPTDLPHQPGMLGIIDDPDRQCTEPLRWGRENGHLLLAGSVGSGITSALVSLGAEAIGGPRPVDLYVIDAVGGAALDILATHARCAAVVRLHERERAMRLLHRLAAEVSHRSTADPTAATEIDTVLLIDGIAVFRHSLDQLDSVAELEALDHIIAHGAAVGVIGVFATDRLSAMSSATLVHCPQRWVLHLADPHDAQTVGIRACDVPAAVPGRLVVATCGREAQLSRPPASPAGLPDESGPSRAAPITCLPACVDIHSLPPAACGPNAIRLPTGIGFVDLQPAALEVPDGDHVMVIGPSQSGRTTALQRVVAAWQQACADGWVGLHSPRRPVPTTGHGFGSLAELLAAIPSTGYVLIAVDDADLVDDPTGALAALAASRRPNLMLVAVGRPESLRQAYGHWTAVVRRSRIGILSAACSDLDGDLLGAVLPRRPPIRTRAGLAWLTSNGSVQLVQVARGEPQVDGGGQ